MQIKEENISYYKFSCLLLKGGWLSPAYIGLDQNGLIQYLSPEKPLSDLPVDAIDGAALPGFYNAHSHAFQYGMVGKAEKHPAGTKDDFWSWREQMYECALSYNPPEMKSVALKLYQQMLKNGYTHVAEFHYLHHDKNGKPYANLAEMGESLVEAAAEAGIKITLIPIFYQKSNFGQEPLARQSRFISKNVDEYFSLLESSKAAVSKYKYASLGFGVHSLRAVNAEDIITTYTKAPLELPFHLHAAEQLKEVEDCINFTGQRPVEWLLNNMKVGQRFNIVHCTHMNEREIKGLAESGANVILCPGTEANLGDGIFPLKDYTSFKGAWAIGSDSHISLNPLEDLRWLDYTQRLISHKRNTFNDGASHMIERAFSSGRRAMGEPFSNYFEVGKAFDAAIYDLRHPVLAQAGLEFLLSAIVYTGGTSALLDTIVNGKFTG